VAAHPVGLMIRRATPSATVGAIVRADELGVGTVWSTVGGVSQDAVTLFAAAAQRTRQIGFGTSIVPTYPRHPLVLASQVIVLADLAPGRFRLGIGPSHRPTVEGMYGIPFTKPPAYMREYLTILRQLLWDGHADFEGELLSVHGAALPADIAPPRTPILISALRANAFRLAGEIADGAISWVCPVPYLVETALPALEAGADAAGRPVPPLVVHVPVAVHEDGAVVRGASRAALGHYARLPYYARMFADAGFPIGPGGALTDELVQALVVSGTPDAITARLSEILSMGFAELLLTQVPVENAEHEEAELIGAITALP
jgi:F420-dependent oxidoreductase-like protein